MKRGMAVVEMTSGNMGAGLAVVCAALDLPLIVTMSSGNSPARARMMEALGAEVVIVEQCEGIPGHVTGGDIEAAAAVARQIAADRGGFYINQFHAAEAICAHENGTGQEILKQAACRIDGWVAAVGTGATFIGVGKALKTANPDTIRAAVEPAGSRPLTGTAVVKPTHTLQGTGYGLVPPHWDPSAMDLSIAVSDDDAALWRRKLATEEGLHVGYSSAANVCAAMWLLRSGQVRSDAIIATVLCDTGLKY